MTTIVRIKHWTSDHWLLSNLKFQFSEKDTDFDYKTDQMALQMTIQTPAGYHLSNFNLFLLFDATIKVRSSHLSKSSSFFVTNYFSTENVSAKITSGSVTPTDAGTIEL